MPYKSDAQRRYFNANRDELEAQGVDVNEWNDSSRGKKLPKRAKKKREKKAADPIERALQKQANPGASFGAYLAKMDPTARNAVLGGGAGAALGGGAGFLGSLGGGSRTPISPATALKLMGAGVPEATVDRLMAGTRLSDDELDMLEQEGIDLDKIAPRPGYLSNMFSNTVGGALGAGVVGAGIGGGATELSRVLAPHYLKNRPAPRANNWLLQQGLDVAQKVKNEGEAFHYSGLDRPEQFDAIDKRTGGLISKPLDIYNKAQAAFSGGKAGAAAKNADILKEVGGVVVDGVQGLGGAVGELLEKAEEKRDEDKKEEKRLKKAVKRNARERRARKIAKRDEWKSAAASGGTNLDDPACFGIWAAKKMRKSATTVAPTAVPGPHLPENPDRNDAHQQMNAQLADFGPQQSELTPEQQQLLAQAPNAEPRRPLPANFTPKLVGGPNLNLNQQFNGMALTASAIDGQGDLIDRALRSIEKQAEKDPQARLDAYTQKPWKPGQKQKAQKRPSPYLTQASSAAKPIDKIPKIPAIKVGSTEEQSNLLSITKSAVHRHLKKRGRKAGPRSVTIMKPSRTCLETGKKIRGSSKIKHVCRPGKKIK